MGGAIEMLFSLPSGVIRQTPPLSEPACPSCGSTSTLNGKTINKLMFVQNASSRHGKQPGNLRPVSQTGTDRAESRIPHIHERFSGPAGQRSLTIHLNRPGCQTKNSVSAQIPPSLENTVGKHSREKPRPAGK